MNNDCFKRLFLFSLLIVTQIGTAQTVKISRGDVLEIVIYNQPELSKVVTVREDGTVDYPFISGIPIDALSVDEFRDLLAAQVVKYTGQAPIITVQYSHRLTIPVVILGQVAAPGEIMVPKNATLQGALTLAGGPTTQAELNKVKVIRREGNPPDTLVVDLYAFSIKGDPAMLPPLKDGDIIFVPGIPGISDVKVIGEVGSPGNITVPPGTSLLDVLFLAGGPTKLGDLNRIRLYNQRTRQETRVHLQKMIEQNRFEEIPQVNPGDVVVVEVKPRFWAHMLEGLRVAVTIATPIIMILYYTGVIDRR